MRVLVLALLLLPAAASAEEWALVGLVRPEEPPVEAELRKAFEALSERLPPGERVLPLEEVATRLGAPTMGREEVERATTEAELLFFQLEYDAARRKLEEALAALERDRGEIPFEMGRDLRLLLALILLQGAGEKEEAARVLAPLAPMHVLPEPIRRASPRPVVELWDEVRAAASARAEGWLVVDCTGCHGGEIWLQGLPVGTTQQSIALAPGRYTLVLRGLGPSEERRSFAREIRIRPGEETRLTIALAAEAAAAAGASTHVQAVQVDEAVEHARSLAKRVGADRLLAWRFEEEAVRVWAFGPSGEEVGTWSRKLEAGDLDSALRELAEAILLPAPTPSPTRAPLSLAADSFVHREVEPSWRPMAKWASVGAAVAFTAVATWLTLEASAAQSDLEGLQAGPGSYATVDDGRRASRLADAIDTRRTWSAIFWTGAAASALGTLYFFLEEGGPPSGER